MSRNICIAAVLFAALLLAVFVWLWVDAEWGISSAPPNTMPPETDLIQTPPVPRSINADKSDGKAEETEVGAADGSRSQDSLYQFKDWEEALDCWANLVAEEFEMLLRTESFNHPFDLVGTAYHTVLERVMDKEDPLSKALTPYLPLNNLPGRIPTDNIGPVRFLIRTGHMSPDVFKIRLKLPTGEIYMADSNEHVVMTYKVLRPLYPFEKEGIAFLEKQVLDLEARLSATPNDAALQQKLDRKRAELEEMKQPKYVTHWKGGGAANRGQPGFRITEMDFGILRPEDMNRETSGYRGRLWGFTEEFRRKYPHLK